VTPAEIDAIAQQVLAVCRPVWRADYIEQAGKMGFSLEKSVQGVHNDVVNVQQAVADDATKAELDAAVQQLLTAIAAIPGGSGPFPYTITGELNPKTTP
jgi:hypothetical protein